MEHNELIERLKRLNEDLNCGEREANTLIHELTGHYKSTGFDLMDEYARLFAPVKTSPDPDSAKGGPVDMTKLMVDFSEGYTEFVAKLESAYINILEKRRGAVDLFSKMVSLPFPEARILFLTYYKNMSPEEIRDCLYISRATYYRSKKAAIESLREIFENG